MRTLLLLPLLLTGCLAYSKVTHKPKATQDKALAADMIGFAAIEGWAFTNPSDRQFLMGYTVGGVMLLTDMITSIIVDGVQK